MTVPTFLGMPKTLIPAGAGSGVPTSRADLEGFAMTGQELSNWCWAAVTQAVERHLNTSVSQTEVATSHIARSRPNETCVDCATAAQPLADCAADACLADCNAPHSLGAVLSERGRLDQALDGGAPQFSTIVSQVRDELMPVPCRVEWKGGGAHFICIAGYADGGGDDRFVQVYDPLHSGIGAVAVDRRTLRYADFCTQYPGYHAAVGKISHSYLVS